MNKSILTLIFFCYCIFLSAQEISKVNPIEPEVKLTTKDRIKALNETYKSSYKLKGFRIQIYSGDKKGQREARFSFMQSYKNAKAHETYNQPYFKVRVGDFKTKIEALKFKNKITKNFPNCFIVNDYIDINELIK